MYQLVSAHQHSGAKRQNKPLIFLGISKRIYAGNTGNDYHVSTLKKCRRGAVSKHIYLVIYHSVLFDIHILAGDISLRLIVIVIGNEILYRVIGKELSELTAKLSRKSFVVCQNKRGTIQPRNNVCHSKGLARTCNAKKGLHSLALLDTLNQRFYSLGLISRGRIFTLKNKSIHSRFLLYKLFYHYTTS